MAERVGFEPTCPCGQDAFEAPPLRPLRYLSVDDVRVKRTFYYTDASHDRQTHDLIYRYRSHQSRRRRFTSAYHAHNGYSAATTATQIAYVAESGTPQPGGAVIGKSAMVGDSNIQCTAP